MTLKEFSQIIGAFQFLYADFVLHIGVFWFFLFGPGEKFFNKIFRTQPRHGKFWRIEW